MMRFFNFNRDLKLPLVSALVQGKNGINLRAKLIFDTGAVCTQFNTAFIDDLGYSAATDGKGVVAAYGPAGPLQTGYAFNLKGIELLGKVFNNCLVAAYDFDNIAGSRIVGLLGYDLIKEFHLEVNGPKGKLVVFDC